MKLQIEWGKSIALRKSRRNENLIYTIDTKKLPDSPGVYVFARRFAKSFEALYVGQAGSIRGRVTYHHRNNLSLMLHLKNAKIGRRSAAKLLTRDEAFLIAVNIAKLPSVLRQILKDIPRPPNSASPERLFTCCRAYDPAVRSIGLPVAHSSRWDRSQAHHTLSRTRPAAK
jgi:hypothetical protein